MSAPAPTLTGRRPAVRQVTVRPAPRREPPFDDDLAARRLHSVGPLDQPLPFATPSRPTALTLASFTHRQTFGDASLPDPAGWSRRLLIAVAETAAGHRPLQQLAALLSPSVAQGLGADFERAAQRRRRHWLHAAGVRSVRACEPTDGVAEVAATVQVGPRVRAIAMRLEVYGGRWRCTRLHLG